jgi:hypothetical protein
MVHSPSVIRQTNEKSHPWPEQAPNGINAAAIDGLADIGLQNEIVRSSLRHQWLRENSFAMHAFGERLIVS